MNDVENRLTAALNAVAEEAQIDHDAWQQNEERLHAKPRSAARKYLALSSIGLAAASVAAVVAVAVWPHGHGTATPAAPTPAPTSSPSTPAPTTVPSQSKGIPSTTPPAAVSTGTAAPQNLTIPDDVRQQLLTAFVAAKKIQSSEISGTRPGSVYYGYLPATDTYWAVADFALSSTAAFQTKVNFQDGGSTGIFHRRPGQAWQVTIGGIPWPCPGDLPDAMLAVWQLPISPSCTVVVAAVPDRTKLDKDVSLPDGTYYGIFETLQYDYDDTGYVFFDPYTWTQGGAPVDNQPATWGSLTLNSRTTTTYEPGSQTAVTEGVFDPSFARRVAAAMPQYAGHLTNGYVVTVQAGQVTAVTEIGPNNPMPASHPSYIEPTS